MSFILDALRKSEADRAQRAAPGLADVRYEVPQPAKGNKWIPVIAALLIVNAALVAFVLLSDGDDTAEPVSVPATQVPEPERRPQATPSVRPLAEELVEPPVTPRAQTPPPAALPGNPVPATPAPPPAQPTGALNDGLPSYQQLVAGGSIALPDLHLDMHVYSPDQNARFIFINMKKYKEKERLVEGPDVGEITETGVILDYQGIRFFLDRE